MPAVVVGIDAEAMEDGTVGVAEARVDLHKVGLFRPLGETVDPPQHVATAIKDHRQVSGEQQVADAGDELHVSVGGAATARPSLVVAVDARRRVVNRPQAVAAVAAGIVGPPGPRKSSRPRATGSAAGTGASSTGLGGPTGPATGRRGISSAGLPAFTSPPSAPGPPSSGFGLTGTAGKGRLDPGLKSPAGDTSLAARDGAGLGPSADSIRPRTFMTTAICRPAETTAASPTGTHHQRGRIRSSGIPGRPVCPGASTRSFLDIAVIFPVPPAPLASSRTLPPATAPARTSTGT